MGLKAKGMLRHIFHGNDETARILLFFPSVEDAEQAIHSLSICKWRIIEDGRPNLVKEEYKAALATSVNSEQLNNLKEYFKSSCNLTILPCGWKHCKDQCKNAPIDTLAHSVDVGASFTVEIPFPAVPNEQEKLF